MSPFHVSLPRWRITFNRSEPCFTACFRRLSSWFNLNLSPFTLLDFSSFARWLLHLLQRQFRFKNRFFFNFFTVYIMRIFYYTEQWPYCHQHSFPTLNRHLYPAQTYGTNLKASDRSILTRPMPLLMLYTFLRLTTLMKKLLWMICWNLIFLNHINMLLLHRLMPFQIHRSSQPRHRHLQNANRRPKQLPKHLRNAVDFTNSRDPVPRALWPSGLPMTNKNFVLWNLMRNLDFRGVWSRPRWANPKLTFAQCGTSSKTHLVEYLRCANGKKDLPPKRFTTFEKLLFMSHHPMLRMYIFTRLPLCYRCLTHYCTVDYLEPFELSLYTCRQLFYYVSPHSPGSILSAASHGQRPHLAHQTITLSDQSIFFRYGYLTVPSSTGLDTSVYYTPSTGHPAIGFETIGSQKSVLQHLGTQGRRQPLHWNIWQPFPDLQSDLPRLRLQSFCFGLENRGDRYHSTKMVDTPSGHRLLHDDRYGPRSPDAWWSSPLSFGHLELVLSFLEDSPTPRCLHVSRVLTSCADTTSRSTWYGLCCTNSSDSSRASFRYGNEIYKNCRLNLETHSCQPRKEMKTGTLLEIVVPFRWKSWLPIFYLFTPGFLEFHRSYFLFMMFFSNLILDLHSGNFRLQIAFELIFIPPLHGEPHGWWLTPDASSTLFDELDQYHWPIFTIWWSNLGIVYSPCGQNDSNFYHRPHYFHQEDHLPLHFSTWWTLDLGTDRRWQRNLEACWNIFGKHAPHAWPSDTTHHRQPMAPVLRHTRPLILLLYGNTISGSSTSWTYQRPCLTTIWGHTGSTTHSPILLGRSAQHHSQGTTTSLSWPPWRSTPPSSPSATLHRTLHSNTPTTPLHHPHRPVPPDEPGPMDMSDSSV